MILTAKFYSKDDDLVPFGKMLKEYDEKYFIYDYSVYKMGFYNTHWIDIEVEFKKRTAVSMLERKHVHEVSSVVKMLIEKLETIDEPATWEESSNEKE